MIVRLQKHLADCGVASRRKSEELILAGKVSVNGIKVTELGTKIDDEKDSVTFNGALLSRKEAQVYLMLHKPEEYVTTSDDQFGRPTVLDLVKESVKERVYPVGRLDYDTSGLLLLTNDGDFCNKLTHPKYEVEKTYIARVSGIPAEDELTRVRRGLEIENYKTAPAKIEVIKSESNMASLKITIWEGRNRQVRKMCEAIGLTVRSLKRVSIGELSLGSLPKGKFRKLSSREIKYLKGLK